MSRSQDIGKYVSTRVLEGVWFSNGIVTNVAVFVGLASLSTRPSYTTLAIEYHR